MVLLVPQGVCDFQADAALSVRPCDMHNDSIGLDGGMRDHTSSQHQYSIIVFCQYQNRICLEKDLRHPLDFRVTRVSAAYCPILT